MGDLIYLDDHRARCSVCGTPMYDRAAGRHVDSRLDAPLPGGGWFCDLRRELVAIREVVERLTVAARPGGKRRAATRRTTPLELARVR
jgi:hypothetical protein